MDVSMIREEIDISTIKHNLTLIHVGFANGNYGSSRRKRNAKMATLWKSVNVGEIFKKPFHGRMKVCIKISDDWYVALEYIGGTYLQLVERRWVYRDSCRPYEDRHSEYVQEHD